MGRFSIAARSTVVVRTVALVSTALGVADTVTVSWTPPTCSVRFNVSVAPTVTTTLAVAGWRSANSTLTSYEPGGRSGRVYSPSSFAGALRV
jgi:hypothetical protein